VVGGEGELGGIDGGNKGKISWCRSLGWKFFVVGHGIGIGIGLSLRFVQWLRFPAMTIARQTRPKPRTRLKIYRPIEEIAVVFLANNYNFVYCRSCIYCSIPKIIEPSAVILVGVSFSSTRFYSTVHLACHTLHLQIRSAISAMDTALLVQYKGTSHALIISEDLGCVGLRS
jgi:hypothetical protein